MQVPRLLDGDEPGRREARPAAQRWRQARRALRAGHPAAGALGVRLAVVTDGGSTTTAAELRACGCEVVGLLAPDPFESLAWAGEAGVAHAYADVDALVSDEVEAACLDTPVRNAVPLAGALLTAGVGVLLARPEPLELSAVRELHGQAEVGQALGTVALRTRAWVAAGAAQRLAGELGPLRQLTVLGWPLGRAARLELIDLVRRLCGDVLAVCAAPGGMPASALAGQPVTLALLTQSGATVLAAESSSGALETARLTLIGAAGRLLLSADQLLASDARGVRRVPVVDGRWPSPLAVAATGLAPCPIARPEVPAATAATLADLLAASRVSELAAVSLQRGEWVEG